MTEAAIRFGGTSGLLYLVAALVFACASAVIARGKGRDYRLWFVLGLLAGGFAVIIVAVLPRPGNDAREGL